MIRIIDSREAELIKPIEPINNTSITKNEVRYGEQFQEDKKALKIEPIDPDTPLVFDDMLQDEIQKIKSKTK